MRDLGLGGGAGRLMYLLAVAEFDAGVIDDISGWRIPCDSVPLGL